MLNAGVFSIINDAKQVVWSSTASDTDDHEIFVYEHGTGTTQLTDNLYHDIDPQIVF